MLRKILIGVAVLIVALVVLVAMQPSTYSVARSTTISAPPEKVFAQVNDLAAWKGWSPFEKLDPNAKMTVSSPSAGEGASISWSGNSEVGEGTMTIIESRPNELVELEQVFVKPLPGTARMALTLAPEAGGTRLTWRLTGENTFTGKAMCLLMDMESVIGPHFEQGLASIKTIAEGQGA